MRKPLEWDERWSIRLRIAEQPGRLRTLAAILAHSGDSWFWAFGLVVLWLVGADFWKQRAVSLAAGIALTAIIVMPLKFLIRRSRPAGKWGAMYRRTDPHSFPSGHAARAVMLSVAACGLGPAWLGAALLVWAPLVALARVAMGVHYLSDVFAGAILGAAIGFLFFHLWGIFP